MTEKTIPQKGKEQDGFVVWDKQGLVVAWPDQHRSRFSWEALRHLCLCAECREHTARKTPKHFWQIWIPPEQARLPPMPRRNSWTSSENREFRVVVSQ